MALQNGQLMRQLLVEKGFVVEFLLFALKLLLQTGNHVPQLLRGQFVDMGRWDHGLQYSRGRMRR